MKRIAILVCLALAVATGKATAQNDQLVDSLVKILPNMADDTNKVIAILDLSFYTYANNPDVGIKYAEQALALSESLKYRSGTAGALRNLGMCYGAKSIYAKALEFYFKALKIYEELVDTFGIGRTNLSIALAYINQFEFKTADPFFAKALECFVKIDKKSAIASTYNNMGISASKQKNHAGAAEYYEKALKINQEIGNIRGIESSKSNLSNTYISLNRFDDAIAGYKDALEINNTTGNHQFRAVHMMCLGDIYLKRFAEDGNQPMLDKYFGGDRNKAIGAAMVYLDSALAIFIENGNVNDRYEVHKSMSLAYSLLGDYKNALLQHQEYTLLKDSLFSDDNTKANIELRMQYDFEKKEAIATEALRRQELIRNVFMGGFAFMLLFAGVALVQRNRIRKEKDRSDELLLNILPYETAQELKSKGSADAQLIDQATVLFTDFKGFTQMSQKLSPKELVAEINDCFSEFDRICERHGIEKIKTIGDAYMAAGGLPTANGTHATDVVKAALEIRDYMNRRYSSVANQLSIENRFQVRIGVNTGPVVAGIVGIKKFQYDIWGDTVNTANRMESSGEVGMVNISQTTYDLVKDQFACTYRGEVEAKGKGMIKMYFVE